MVHSVSDIYSGDTVYREVIDHSFLKFRATILCLNQVTGSYEDFTNAVIRFLLDLLL